MKKIAVLCPDPIENRNTSNTLTHSAKRSLKLAEYLNKMIDLDVTLLLPNKNKDYQNKNFNIDYYSFSGAYFNLSQELDKKLMKFDFVIVQLTSGCGLYNCTILPSKVNVIIDGFDAHITSLPRELLTKHKIQRRFEWDRYIIHYQNLLKRANCLLYSNEFQHNFYEGQFFMIDKLGWKAYKFSPMHKIPFGIEKNKKYKKIDNNDLKILWYGDITNYEIIENLINKIIKNQNIQLDIILPEDQFYKQKYKSVIETIQNKAKNNKNITLLTNTSLETISHEYDTAVYSANSILEDKYYHRINIIELLSYGIPVIINGNIDIYNEYEFLQNNGLFKITDDNSFNEFISKEKKIKYNDIAFKKFQELMSWDNVIKPLINYIRSF